MNGSDGTAGLEKQDFMKDLFKFGRLLVAAAVLTCAAGCSDDKDGSGGPELPDPEGTVLVSMRYSTKVTYTHPYGGSYVYFQEYPIDSRFYHNTSDLFGDVERRNFWGQYY